MEPNGNSHVFTGHSRRFIRIGTTIRLIHFCEAKNAAKGGD
ncbi:unnamed protein product [Brassica rapa]|uniref:Uncharacterized protein n=1 Tax=Brassica campestris TaxID=3711 RepID=A0A3P6B0Y3_BRACM|nr:unnamed protein product [Brassica rapa]VDC95825.1 unnamed protein product [Brassica rapa]